MKKVSRRTFLKWGVAAGAVAVAAPYVMMNKNNMFTSTLTEMAGAPALFDVLVIGSGGSGMRAALEAGRQKDLKVALMTKLVPTRSATCMAQGGINGALRHADARDSIEKHAFDTVKGSDYLGDQDAIRFFAEKAPEALRELDYYGVAFDRMQDGRMAQRNLGGHTYARSAYSADQSGLVILHTLFEQCLKNNVNMLMEWQLLELVVEDGKLCGVVAMNMHSGKILPVMARTVVVATGGYGRLYWVRTTNPFSSTGDGIGACLKVGIPVKDPEMVQFHPTGLAGSGVLLSEAARGEGGYLVNKDGERFMRRYAPDKMELGPRDLVSQAIETEIREGRGVGEGLHAAVYLDLRHLGKKKIMQKLPQLRQLALNYEGVDAITQPIPIRGTCHYSMGGIDVVDYKTCATAIPGVFAVGECSCLSVHGANRLGGNSLAEVVVFGKYAGNGAAAYARNNAFDGNQTALDRAADEWEQRFAAVSSRSSGSTVPSIRDRMAATMWQNVGIFRSRTRLEQAVRNIDELLEEYRSCVVRDTTRIYNTAFMNYVELGNMLPLARMVAMAALARQESRGSHFREDYPRRNDQKFLQHTIVTRKGAEYSLTYRPVAITDYQAEERKY
ncbi:MAG: FAD-binding protein [Veillonellales bacterium]